MANTKTVYPNAEEGELETSDHIPFVQDSKQIYDLQTQLGRGAFCKVYKASFLPTGEEVAVKVSKSCNPAGFPKATQDQ